MIDVASTTSALMYKANLTAGVCMKLSLRAIRRTVQIDVCARHALKSFRRERNE